MLCRYVAIGSVVTVSVLILLFFFKQKTAYEMRISDWSSDVCSSDLHARIGVIRHQHAAVQKTGLSKMAAGDAGPLTQRSNIERHKIGRASCRERECQYV